VFDLAPVRHLEGFRSSDQFNPVLEKLDITRTPFSIEPKSLIVVSCSPSYGTTIEWLHAGIELLRGSREPSLSQERSKRSNCFRSLAKTTCPTPRYDHCVIGQPTMTPLTKAIGHIVPSVQHPTVSNCI
jgi:hypothetical protein